MYKSEKITLTYSFYRKLEIAMPRSALRLCPGGYGRSAGKIWASVWSGSSRRKLGDLAPKRCSHCLFLGGIIYLVTHLVLITSSTPVSGESCFQKFSNIVCLGLDIYSRPEKKKRFHFFPSWLLPGSYLPQGSCSVLFCFVRLFVYSVIHLGPHQACLFSNLPTGLL